MKILLISEANYSLDIFLRMQKRGNQVKVWTKESGYKQIYTGMMEKVPDWRDALAWCDAVFFDHSGMSDIWKEIKGKKPCFGGSEWGDKIEKQRTFAHKVFDEIGLEHTNSHKVSTIEDAIAFVSKKKMAQVVKPVGKDVDSHHVIIGEYDDNSDVIALLESFKDKGLKPEYLEIEDRLKGIEIGVSGWHISDGKGNGAWSGDINLNFEHKRTVTAYPEGIGPLCGEAGTAMRYVSQNNRFFNKTLDKISKVLAKEDYRGQADISFIVDVKTGVARPLEGTFRTGYPAIYIENDLQITPLEELYYNTAIGNTKFQNKVSRDWAIGVVMFMPGFPSNDEAKKRSEGIPIFKDGKAIKLKDIPMKSVHLVEVKSNKEGIVTAPGMGYPVVVTGTGKTLEEAKRNCYWNISLTNSKRFYIPNAYWRTDIGDRVARQMHDIERLGILDDVSEVSPEIAMLVS